MENAINTSKCLHASINLLSSVKEIEIMPHAAHVCSLPCEARDTNWDAQNSWPLQQNPGIRGMNEGVCIRNSQERTGVPVVNLGSRWTANHGTSRSNRPYPLYSIRGDPSIPEALQGKLSSWVFPLFPYHSERNDS